MIQQAVRDIKISQPYIGDDEKQAVLEVLDSGHLAQGAQVAAFEEAFAHYHGVRHGVAISNGTAALVAIMYAHGIGPGDEVIVPAFSFFATASCVMAVGARPIFADIDPDTYCLSPAAAAACITPRTAAIMPVHLYGQPADMRGFEALCKQHNLLLLEDAAQAHGAAIDGHYIGTWGSAAFSFYATKNMMTGEGGMVLTNDEAIARKVRMYINQGMSRQYQHEIVGYNFRMTNIAGAIGLAQLKRLPEWTERRRQNAAYFDQHLKTVKTPVVGAGMTHVYHQYTVRVAEGVDRDEAVRKLQAQGIGVRLYYPAPIYRQPALSGYEDVYLEVTEQATREVFSLPVHPKLSQDDLAYIVEGVNSLC
jgi:perosamine synthetase